MKLSPYTVVMALTLLAHTTFAQIKNSKLATVDINGNCGMCKSNIEKAGNKDNEATVVWNSKTGQASITYDATKTDEDAILKRIALSGYDNERYLAPDEAYSALHSCCQYERTQKSDDTAVAPAEHVHGASNTAAKPTDAEPAQVSAATALDKLMLPYVKLKNALVDANTQQAALAAKELDDNLRVFDSQALPAEQLTVWTKEGKNLTQAVATLRAAQSIDLQRQQFSKLSHVLYKFVKAGKKSGTIYYQFCPMYNDGKGAHWLSEKSAVENPYYGSEMLSCGKTVETL
ncbi:DUF3347 domain-containing protein [Sphingobacterium paludis]|uniref:Copper chaperone CopZ n=1 Tax=Sphingobacterium paludis TaxID=1476465 RepID=A0A4R7CVL2_9SPHI|nr:DUF3347 domain-containing protein [Sphingobacterium paludis]TDS11897.1 copper chaperone CopZ [Sphingobacterium paludis]